MNIKDLLPIGSVVLLKDGQKRLMITGVKQTDLSEDGREYDYFGVLYPEGHIGEDFQYLFDHEDIQQIFFRGFEDEERARFLTELEAVYQGPAGE